MLGFKNIFIKLMGIGLLSYISISCNPEIDSTTPTRGEADFTTFVAVGNSLTAGFADGALYRKGQEYSFVNIMAQQMSAVGRTSPFNTPFVNISANDIGVGSTGNARLILGQNTNCLGVSSLGPRPSAVLGDLSNFTSNIFSSAGPFHNIGVPGATVLTGNFVGYGNNANGFGRFNPYYFRMARNPQSSSMVGDAVALNPTFFSYFLGNNDVLSFATSGGLEEITPPRLFELAVSRSLTELTSGGAKGVVGNIPDVTSIPFFTTIPYNPLTLNQAQADQLNAAYAIPIQAGVVRSFTVGRNPLIIEDPTVLPFRFRSAVPQDLICITIPQDSIICGPMGTRQPVPSEFVLDSSERRVAVNAVIEYNATLRSLADQNNLAYVDVNAFLSQAKTGLTFDGISVSATFVTGGVFSLDGVHLTPRGNALLANEFIRTINAKYGATIPTVSPTLYEGVLLP